MNIPHYLEPYNDLFRILALPLAKQIPALKELRRKLDQQMNATKGDSLWHIDYSLVNIFLPTVFTFNMLHVKSIARVRAAVTACALERYRLKHGTLPESLDQLVPGFIKAVPLDPFDGKPLRYKILDNGYAVYSVGENGVDDSDSDGDLVGWDFGDVLFRVIRVEHAEQGKAADEK